MSASVGVIGVKVTSDGANKVSSRSESNKNEVYVWILNNEISFFSEHFNLTFSKSVLMYILLLYCTGIYCVFLFYNCR